MTQNAKIIKRENIVDTSPEKNVLSRRCETSQQIDRLESRFSQSRGQENKSSELLFELLRSINDRLAAIEKV